MSKNQIETPILANYRGQRKFRTRTTSGECARLDPESARGRSFWNRRRLREIGPGGLVRLG